MPRLSLEQRLAKFWSRVDKSGGDDACWLWTGFRDKDGYGDTSWFYRASKTHRIAYEHTIGAIPAGQSVLHSCDNPSCCNPKHLFLGTQADNVRDRVAKHRSATGESHGSRTHPERVLRGSQHPARLHPERMARGENVFGAKLTEDDVREIRRVHALGTSQRHLAKRYGVDKGTIAMIVKRQTWKHVTD